MSKGNPSPSDRDRRGDAGPEDLLRAPAANAARNGTDDPASGPEEGPAGG